MVMVVGDAIITRWILVMVVGWLKSTNEKEMAAGEHCEGAGPRVYEWP